MIGDRLPFAPPDIDTDATLVRDGVRAMLRLAGEDPTRAGLIRTPERFLKAWLELNDSPGDPADLLSTTFNETGPIDQMITIGPIPFASNCEHHLLPFTGTAWIAYIPAGRIVGLSKIPRLVRHYAHRPQVQERLTGQITAAIDEHVPNKGSACLIRAVHQCASLRGVRTPAPMTTTSVTGLFKTDLAARTEFLDTTRL